MSIVPSARPATEPLECPAWCCIRHAEWMPVLEPDLSELVIHELPTRMKAPGTTRPMPRSVEAHRLDTVDRLGGTERGKVGIVVDGQSDDPLTSQEARDLAAALLELAAIVDGDQ